MTVASEITRLQGAKADIRTAIQNKGVTVPASAKLDTYDDYIAQITTGSVFMDNLKLKEYRVDVVDDTPRVEGFISRNTGSKYYGAIVLYFESRSSTGHEYSYYDLVAVTKESGSDMWYKTASHNSFYRSIHGAPYNVTFYKKPGAIRGFFYEYSSYSSNWIFWFQFDWNTETNEMSVVNFTRNESTTLPSSADTTGYTQTTENSWIKSVTGTNTDDDANIYLTLK